MTEKDSNIQHQILYDSDEAAKYVTGIEGWTDRHGHFFGNNEDVARYSGSTHRKCRDCENIIPTRGYLICGTCRGKAAIGKYNARPRQKWDGDAPLYSDADDEYFFDVDSLRDHMEEHECTLESLRLVICKPQTFRELEDDYFCDELPEDGELPDSVITAMNELNAVLRAQGPASWVPGKYAAEGIIV